MRHSKFILKRDLTLRHLTSLQQFLCECVWVGVTKELTRPDSAGLPNSVSLPPTTCHFLGWLRGRGQRGRGRTADTGEPGPAFTPGRYCTRENVSTKDHMAPFCIEPLDKGVGGGRGSCQKAHFQGHRPRPLQTAGWQLGENGGTFSPLAQFLRCSCPFPPSRVHAQGGFPTPRPTHQPTPGQALPF